MSMTKPHEVATMMPGDPTTAKITSEKLASGKTVYQICVGGGAIVTVPPDALAEWLVGILADDLELRSAILGGFTPGDVGAPGRDISS